ncbi:MAG: L-fucose mutarotase, partial [uncultured Rubellimicrobium sp.]
AQGDRQPAQRRRALRAQGHGPRRRAGPGRHQLPGRQHRPPHRAGRTPPHGQPVRRRGRRGDPVRPPPRHLRGRLRRPHGGRGRPLRGAPRPDGSPERHRPRRRPRGAHDLHRALRLLRHGARRLCRDPDRRAPLLRLHHVPQGRHPARGL